MNRRTLLLTLLLVLIAAISHWLSRESDMQRKILPQGPRHVPDHFTTNFTATTMGVDGTPAYRLTAEKSSHFADDGTTELTRPHLIMFGKDSKQWQAYAEKGQVSANADDVYLSGGVRLEQTATASEYAGVRMTTEDMHIQIGSQFAETDAPVTVTGPGSQVEAIGMRAYIGDQRVILMSKVRGTYAPPRH